MVSGENVTLPSSEARRAEWDPATHTERARSWPGPYWTWLQQLDVSSAAAAKTCLHGPPPGSHHDDDIFYPFFSSLSFSLLFSFNKILTKKLKIVIPGPTTGSCLVLFLHGRTPPHHQSQSKTFFIFLISLSIS